MKLARIGRRVAAGLLLIVMTSALTFVMLSLLPGDPAARIAGEGASEEQIERVRVSQGLDRPTYERFGEWLFDAVRGDLGNSLYSRQPVTTVLQQSLPITVSLSLLALVIALLVAIPLALCAASRPQRFLDRSLTIGASAAMAIPPFIVGLILISIFALHWKIFPATGYQTISEGGVGGWLRSALLPAIALAAVPTAEIMRQTRGALIDAMAQDYVRAARARGIPQGIILLKHALRNASARTITVLGLQTTRLISGAVVVETIFAIPGFGSAIVAAVLRRDIPVVQSAVVVSAALVIVANIVVDWLATVSNPKTRS